MSSVTCLAGPFCSVLLYFIFVLSLMEAILEIVFQGFLSIHPFILTCGFMENRFERMLQFQLVNRRLLI